MRQIFYCWKTIFGSGIIKTMKMKLTLLVVLFSLLYLPGVSTETGKLLVLEDVTVIDGLGNLPQPASNIFIEKGKIIRICKKGDYKIPKNAQVMNLRDKHVIPGLIEMHTHMFSEEVCKTMLAFGITSARIPAASPNAGTGMRSKTASGEVIGPRILTAGDLIDGHESTTGYCLIVKTEEEVRETVRQQAKTGIDYIKLYSSLEPNLVKAAIDEAHSLGLEVIGHLGKTSWTFAANAGIDRLCHSAMSGPIWELIPGEKREKFLKLSCPIKGFNPDLFMEWGETFDMDGPEMKGLTQALVDNKVVVDPTLVMMEAMIWGDDSNYKEVLEPDFAPENMAKGWRKENLHPYTSWWSKEAFASAKKLFPTFSKIVKRLYDDGVLITAGTDAGNPWVTPGVSLHRELELLTNAGIPALEVIMIATYNGAKALNISDEVGSIEVGKQADLVILDSNPIEDIKNTRKIVSIFKNGKLYKPSELLSSRNN